MKAEEEGFVDDQEADFEEGLQRDLCTQTLRLLGKLTNKLRDALDDGETGDLDYAPEVLKMISGVTEHHAELLAVFGSDRALRTPKRRRGIMSTLELPSSMETYGAQAIQQLGASYRRAFEGLNSNPTRDIANLTSALANAEDARLGDAQIERLRDQLNDAIAANAPRAESKEPLKRPCPKCGSDMVPGLDADCRDKLTCPNGCPREVL